jgi:acyl-ACP thioesterase
VGNIFCKEFELRYFEMDKHGIISPTTILTLLEETAADHCFDIGHDLYSLESQNIGWILISGRINMLRYPKYKEKVKIQTWVSKFTLVKGYRENLIIDNEGLIIGKAKGIWVFYDIKRRRPAPVFEDIKTKWGINKNTSTEIENNLIDPITNSKSKIEFNVYRSDVDSNKHVNNIKYFHWLIESLPEEILDNYLLENINARFYSEAQYGEKILVYANENSQDNSFNHTMKSNVDNKTLAAAHTKWKKISLL